MSKGELVNIISQLIIAETGEINLSIDPKVEFINYGLDSIQGINLLIKLEKELKTEINPLSLWEYPTPEALANHLYQRIKQ